MDPNDFCALYFIIMDFLVWILQWAYEGQANLVLQEALEVNPFFVKIKRQKLEENCTMRFEMAYNIFFSFHHIAVMSSLFFYYLMLPL